MDLEKFMLILNCNSRNKNSNLFNSSVRTALVGGVLGAGLQSACLLKNYAQYKDTFKLSFKEGAAIVAKNAGYCAIVSGLLTFGVNFILSMFKKKNEIQKNSQ